MFSQLLPQVSPHPLPSESISAITIGTLLVLGFFVEEYYVSRLTVFSNSVALITFLNRVQRLDWILILYGAVGGLMGVLGIMFYLQQEEIWVEYYELVFFMYSSAPIGIFILLSLLLTPHWVLLIPAILVGAGVNSKLLLSIKEKTVPVNDLPLAIPVAQWFLDVYNDLR